MRGDNIELKECRMVMKLSTDEKGITTAVAIVINPSKEEAMLHAKQEIEQYCPEASIDLLETKDLGPILYRPIPTTIFLYTQKGGRLK